MNHHDDDDDDDEVTILKHTIQWIPSESDELRNWAISDNEAQKWRVTIK